MFCGLYPKMGGGDRAEETAPPSPLGPDNRQLVGASAAGVAAATTAMEARQRVLAAGIVAGRADMPLAIAGLIALEVVERLCSTRGQRAVVAVVRIKAVVYVAVEAVRAVEPRAGADKQAVPAEPVRAIVAVGRAVIRRVVEVSIRTHRRAANIDAETHLRGCRSTRHKQSSCDGGQNKGFPKGHNDRLLNHRIWTVHDTGELRHPAQFSCGPLYSFGEKSVSFIKLTSRLFTKAPSFSLSAFTFTHSGSAENIFQLALPAARLLCRIM